MSKVIFNNRAYDSIEEASMHLRVPAKDLRAKLERDRKAKKTTPKFAWEHWGFSEEEEYSSNLGSTDDMVDYEMHLDSLQATTRTLEDIAQEDEEMLEADELERASELAICLEAILTAMEEIIEEEKETAGAWTKHND
jgi:hypothetical protein